MTVESLESRNQRPLVERFWERVRKSDGCWEWTGTKRNDYGTMRVAKKHEYAHRISWLIHSGEMPPRDLCVLHHCDNPPCVRPDHLFLGTKVDNARDAASKGRNASQRRPEIRRGENASRHILSEAQVLEIRRRYAAGGVTYLELAKEFGVKKTTVAKIVIRKLWGHLTAEANR